MMHFFLQLLWLFFFFCCDDKGDFLQGMFKTAKESCQQREANVAEQLATMQTWGNKAEEVRLASSFYLFLLDSLKRGGGMTLLRFSLKLFVFFSFVDLVGLPAADTLFYRVSV